MLTTDQFLLTKLAEEAAELATASSEVAKLALKAVQFCLDNTGGDPVGVIDNATFIRCCLLNVYKEYNDLMAVYELLVTAGLLKDVVPENKETSLRAAKKTKVLHYHEVAKQLKRVE